MLRGIIQSVLRLKRQKLINLMIIRFLINKNKTTRLYKKVYCLYKNVNDRFV